MKTLDVMSKRDRDVTMDHCFALCKKGVRGALAVTLFQAFYSSKKAKSYRRRFKSETYSRKSQALMRVNHWCDRLSINTVEGYGWKRDNSTPGFEWVYYVDLSGIGQVSFHSADRGEGPDYDGEWDRVRASGERVSAFCDQILKAPDDPIIAMPFGKHAGKPIEDVPSEYWDWFFNHSDMERFQQGFAGAICDGSTRSAERPLLSGAEGTQNGA